MKPVIKQCLLTYSINPRVIGKTKQGHINAAHGRSEATTSIFDLVEATAIRGQAMMPGLLTHSGKTKNHLHQFCTIVIDIDNSDDTGITTWEQAKQMPFLRDNAVAIWTSTNHRYDDGDPDTHYNGQDWFRILFKLQKDFKLCPAGNDSCYKQIHQIIKRLNALIPGGDPNITPIHYFAGTIDGLVHVFKMGTNKLNVDTLPELPEKPTRVIHNHHNTEPFTGSVQDSINNVRTFLSFISSAEMETRCRIGGCLRNIGETIGDQAALDLFLEWSPKDYDKFDEKDCRKLWNNFEPRPGGFGRLKELAMDNGYEPHDTNNATFDITAFGTSPDGYKAGDEVTIIKSSIDEKPNEAEITAAVNRFAQEIPARQIRMVIEELYGVTRSGSMNLPKRWRSADHQ